MWDLYFLCVWSGAGFDSATSWLYDQEYHIRLSGLSCCVDNIPLDSVWSFSSLNRAITLENQLVILGVSQMDAGGYYVQAVNEKNGENKTSPFIHLSVTREYPNCGALWGWGRTHKANE